MKKLWLLSLHLTIHGISSAQSTKITFECIPDYDILALHFPDYTLRDEVFRYSLLIDDKKIKFTLDSFMINLLPPKMAGYINAEEIYIDYRNSKWMKCSGDYKDGYCLAVDLQEKLDETSKRSWQITDDRKLILGMECKKAVFKEDTAWYTESIPIQFNPGDKLFCLPGAVLKYTTNYGKYTAVAIDTVMQKVTWPIFYTTTEEKEIKISSMDLRKNLPKNVYKINRETIKKEWIIIDRLLSSKTNH